MTISYYLFSIINNQRISEGCIVRYIYICLLDQTISHLLRQLSGFVLAVIPLVLITLNAIKVTILNVKTQSPVITSAS